MNDKFLKIFIPVIIIIGFTLYSTFFIVKETHQAIVLTVWITKENI